MKTTSLSFTIHIQTCAAEEHKFYQKKQMQILELSNKRQKIKPNETTFVILSRLVLVLDLLHNLDTRQKLKLIFRLDK
jgi:hypothetical protein